MRNVKLTSIICLFFLILNSYSWADIAEQQLKKSLGTLQSFSADFEQNLYSAKGKLQKNYSGTCQLKKPRKFYWQIQKPDMVLIVSDGTRIWNYDQDLEQVVIRDFPKLESGLPIRFLVEEESSLAEQFNITSNKTGSFELTPKDEVSPFQKIQLEFIDNKLALLSLVDQTGQRTEIKFSKINPNAKIADSKFKFIPPAGVDVLNNLS